MPGITAQVWGGDDRHLTATIVLEAGPRGGENLGPDAIVRLRRHPMVYVATADGGALYAASFVGSTTPALRLVHDFGPASRPSAMVVTPDDRYLVVALAGADRVVVLDLANPHVPRVVDDVDIPASGFADTAGPGSLAISADGSRVAVANYGIDVPALHEDGDRRVHLLRLDAGSGAVRLDGGFRDEFTGELGIDFGRMSWPHGGTGQARPAALRFVAPHTAGR
jgi:DNA-binding beta-propeller fold protein YncE